MTTMKNPNSSSSKLALLSHIKYEHLVAGISGGVTSTLILHPLDLIKIRFAVNDGRTATVPRYDGLSSAFVTIVKKEGFKGLYRGVTPNVWGSGSAWGFYFLFYNAIKTWIQGGECAYTARSRPAHAGSGRGGEEHIADNKRYKGMVDGLSKIYRTEGIRGLYRGFVPGMFGVSHGALQFMTYEEMKNRYNQYRNLPIDFKLTSVEYLTFAAISKLIAAVGTYPYQVVRARLQDQRGAYTGAWQCVRDTWRYERLAGFYKGLTPYLLHVTPNICLVMLIWEKFTNND
ncbi:hypothetical protein ACJJTC_008299 [Scirpophaga incertulas]